MFEEPNFFWKNFRLGSELQISGVFIYNALQVFDNMETFHNEEESFEFLYNAAVGIERLEKIAVILIEHDENLPQDEFEKSLITHNHLDLLARIKANRKVNLGKTHIKFLSLLASFYKSVRYDRYNFASVYRPIEDKKALIEYISEQLSIEIKTDLMFATGISIRMRQFVGKVIGRITTELYEIICEESNRLRTFTSEIRYNSKAFKIFIAKEFDFQNEKLMQREISLFLLNGIPDGQLKTYIESIEPLNFEGLHTNRYFEAMFNYGTNRDALDEMEYLYEENEINRGRIDEVMVIGSDTNFDYFDDVDESEDIF